MGLLVTLFPRSQTTGVSDTITSNSLAAAIVVGALVNVVVEFGDNADVLTQAITNNNTAVSWTQIQTTNTGSNVRVVHYRGIVPAGATLTTVSVQALTGANITDAKVLYVFVTTGQHSSDPVPAGNLILIPGNGSSSIAQSITPTSPGSYIVMVLGDWQAVDPASGGMAAGAGCVLAVADEFVSGQMTGAVIYPSVQPRTDTVAFILRESDGGATRTIGVAFEIQAEPVASGKVCGDDEGDSFQFVQAA